MTLTTIPLWPDDHPEVAAVAAGERPSMDLYPVDGAGRLLIIYPGGGYARHAPHEGEPVARWANALGISAAVVRYRVGSDLHPGPLRDAVRALRLLRRDGVGGHPVREVAAIGFSAGGHLCGTLATLGNDLGLVADGELDDIPAGVDHAILGYPVVALDGPAAHRGSATNLLGPDATTAQLGAWSVERRVTSDTPRTFIWHTAEDEPVPVANAIMLAEALARNGVEVSLNVFPVGRHGLGLVDGPAESGGWAGILREWLGY
ncbi:MAG TPA: alpha/beta hydrolase [Thermomicrobiales bacterium]|jgi:acetyl esterase/lipase|nr:alpha/beta hydrolase [Thermomicrobiales bacterium]